MSISEKDITIKNSWLSRGILHDSMNSRFARRFAGYQIPTHSKLGPFKFPVSDKVRSDMVTRYAASEIELSACMTVVKEIKKIFDDKDYESVSHYYRRRNEEIKLGLDHAFVWNSPYQPGEVLKLIFDKVCKRGYIPGWSESDKNLFLGKCADELSRQLNPRSVSQKRHMPISLGVGDAELLIKCLTSENRIRSFRMSILLSS